MKKPVAPLIFCIAIVLALSPLIYYKYRLKQSVFEIDFKLLPNTRIQKLSGEIIGYASSEGDFSLKLRSGTYVLKFTHSKAHSLTRAISMRKWFFSPRLDYTEQQRAAGWNPRWHPVIYNESNRLPFEPETMLIPKGEFTMGARKGEGPYNSIGIREVYLDDYAIGRYEVSNEQFAAFVKDTGYKTDAEELGGGFASDGKSPWKWSGEVNWKNPFLHWKKPENFGRLPAVMVSWRDANEYTKWLSRKTNKHYRLPTEAEWEKAARGEDERFYPWGDEWEDLNLYCNHGKFQRGSDPGVGDETDGFLLLAPVDSYPRGASPYGVFNMVGNAKEWVQDTFTSYANIKGETVNPVGPDKSDEESEMWENMKFEGPQKVLRGGGWYDGLGYGLTATYRNGHSERLRFSGVGFRVAEQITK